MPRKKTVQPLPLEELTLEELLKPRKGLRKRKLLHIINGMWSSEPGIGGVKFEAGGGARTMSLAQKLTGCIYSMTTPFGYSSATISSILLPALGLLKVSD